MRNPPIHKQLFFWSTIVIFLIVAPSVVFYTAGYRWNSKKGVIERNGTLIVDTVPEGASIRLNGHTQEKVSPVTIKNLSPGTYTINLDLEGHHPWSKTLQVLPERVTFVNDVILWLNTEPKFLTAGSYGNASISPNGKYLVGTKQEVEEWKIAIVELATGKEVLASSQSTSTIRSFDWSSDSSAVLVAHEDDEFDLIIRRNASKATSLPRGFYRWENGVLVGSVENGRYTYDISTDAAKHTEYAQGVKDALGDYQIISPTSTSNLAMIEKGESVRFDLPPGDWRFVERLDGFIYLRNGNEWLVFDPTRKNASAIRFRAESSLISMSIGKDVKSLSRDGSEISIAGIGQDPELLIRKSDPIVGVYWHESGKYALYATSKNVVALDLDARDHRIETVLASFDQISGFSYQKREVLIVGKKGDQEGIWRLAIE